MNFIRTSLAVIAALGCAATAQAGVTIGATSVTTGMGQYSSTNAVTNLINQSGLVSHYVNGVTDFTSFVSTNHSINAADRWVAAVGHIVGTINFDLGSVQTIDALALWNGSISANRAIHNFTLTGDNNAYIGSFSATNASGSPKPAQVFDFTAISTQHVYMQITSNFGDPNFISTGEVAFDKVVTTVPEPAPLALLGLAGIGLLRRRKSV